MQLTANQFRMILAWIVVAGAVGIIVYAETAGLTLLSFDFRGDVPHVGRGIEQAAWFTADPVGEHAESWVGGAGMDRFAKGDAVTWKSHGGDAVGKVEEEITSNTEAGGRKVKASKEEPQYLVKSDKSGGEAVHKPSALKRKKK